VHVVTESSEKNDQLPSVSGAACERVLYVIDRNTASGKSAARLLADSTSRRHMLNAITVEASHRQRKW
jgi:hypothetical protein